MNFKKVWSDAVWSKVISAGIIFAISTVASFHWWGQVSSGLLWVWNFVVEDVAVPRWLFWVLALCLTGAILLCAALMFSRLKGPFDDRTSYREDIFLGLRWRWRFEGEYLSNISAFCRFCDFQLDVNCARNYFDPPRTMFECSKCGKTSVSFNESVESVENRVTRLIQLALRDGSWKQAKRMTVSVSEHGG